MGSLMIFRDRGINLENAQSPWIRLSGSDAYTLQDLDADQRGRIRVRVRWARYSPVRYEIPLDVDDGRVIMETLSRRVARACIDYLESKRIPVMHDTVELHFLMETEYGVWEMLLFAP
ncbi:hypothetical protein C8R45DRAFT_1033369 [Mycena sanguinolenta]|nr:hypothetical protein C8R45DRAFT_1033369 [Mycena sanguinolenta]